jgi:isoquinoline 1-oxidoreductase subunit alpha
VPEHTFILNGERVTVDVADDVRLLWVLRDLLGVTGPKYGCGVGVCRACTSHLDGAAFNPCVTPVAECSGRTVTTIEGLADGDRLHPLQEAFWYHHGLQCGYCTPGMLLTAKAFLDEHPQPTPAEIREAISGNLCRCTGYQFIVDAIAAAAALASGNDGRRHETRA